VSSSFVIGLDIGTTSTVGILIDFAVRPLSGLGIMQGLQALGLLTWTVGAIAIIGSDIGRSGAKRIELLKANRLCPACGVDLVVRAGTEAGDITCAECRAVWNFSKKDEARSEIALDSPPVEAR